ncbi:putative acylesterase/phospholipase RssA [Bradyrhizobium sp. USDA 4461]
MPALTLCIKSSPTRSIFDDCELPDPVVRDGDQRSYRPGRVFRNAGLTPDVLLASACLPALFRAIEIDGQPYWNGGNSGKPTITPLVRECDSRDTFLVAVNPVERPGTPRSAREILDRLNEVAFNATLLKEQRMIALLRQVAEAGRAAC